ncbi:hypothetical protein JCM11641_005431, partial [Rhodosporidiobolus odoratus]
GSKKKSGRKAGTAPPPSAPNPTTFTYPHLAAVSTTPNTAAASRSQQPEQATSPRAASSRSDASELPGLFRSQAPPATGSPAERSTSQHTSSAAIADVGGLDEAGVGRQNMAAGGVVAEEPVAAAAPVTTKKRARKGQGKRTLDRADRLANPKSKLNKKEWKNSYSKRNATIHAKGKELVSHYDAFSFILTAHSQIHGPHGTNKIPYLQKTVSPELKSDRSIPIDKLSLSNLALPFILDKTEHPKTVTFQQVYYTMLELGEVLVREVQEEYTAVNHKGWKHDRKRLRILDKKYAKMVKLARKQGASDEQIEAALAEADSSDEDEDEAENEEEEEEEEEEDDEEDDEED